MYNPDYLERPYIVVLNKIDLPEVCACCYSSWFGSPVLNINLDFLMLLLCIPTKRRISLVFVLFEVQDLS